MSTSTTERLASLRGRRRETGTSETVLEEGMVFSIEPGLYLPGRFGIRLEEIVILHSGGPEILSDLPRALHVAG